MHQKGYFSDMIQRLRVDLSVQRLTVFKSFRLSRVCRFVPEKIAHYVYQYLTDQQYKTIRDSFKLYLLLLIIIEIC